MIYNKSEMQTFFPDGPSENARCVVRIDGTEIVVEYEGYKGIEIYRGTLNGEGHYNLSCSEVNGRATLHKQANSDYLEGYWKQGTGYGMWRIQLIGEE